AAAFVTAFVPASGLERVLTGVCWSIATLIASSLAVLAVGDFDGTRILIVVVAVIWVTMVVGWLAEALAGGVLEDDTVAATELDRLWQRVGDQRSEH
ncbi:MAG: hypothetical protein P8N02_16900, partial [Actinomycetota bacterium]|nr:hypothetical protein [Actinomycetota bacterium]